MKKIVCFFSLMLFCLPVLCVGVSAKEAGSNTLSSDTLILRVAVCFILAFAIALVAVLLMRRAMSTVRKQKRADNYTRRDSFELTESRDIYLYSTTTRVRINNNKRR